MHVVQEHLSDLLSLAKRDSDAFSPQKHPELQLNQAFDSDGKVVHGGQVVEELLAQ
jgi:hypothetical protein